MRHVFGPVVSRRLGRSLGVDVVPYKTCTFDCVYCQLGRTTCRTITPQACFPVAEIVAEVGASLEACPDYLTISGSGEPTLYAGLGELIGKLKRLTTTPVAVLTNGSLLWRAEVRAALRQADLVMPSLDGADEIAFEVVNRPHEALSLEQVWQGLLEFRRAYAGAYWLEIFLIDGPPSADGRVDRLAERARQLGADRVQLNTLTRPAAECCVAPVSPARLAEIARRFTPPAEVITVQHAGGAAQPGRVSREAVLATLRRRPCTLVDIAAGLGAHRHEVLKILDELLADGQARAETLVDGTYFVLRGRPHMEGNPHAV